MEVSLSDHHPAHTHIRTKQWKFSVFPRTQRLGGSGISHPLLRKSGPCPERAFCFERCHKVLWEDVLGHICKCKKWVPRGHSGAPPWGCILALHRLDFPEVVSVVHIETVKLLEQTRHVIYMMWSIKLQRKKIIPSLKFHPEWHRPHHGHVRQYMKGSSLKCRHHRAHAVPLPFKCLFLIRLFMN